jgi:hypothetical protein
MTPLSPTKQQQQRQTHKVSAKDHARFAESYGTLLKAHMDGLKKKAKKKK